MLIPHRGQTSTILPAFSLLASKIGCLFSTGVSLATYFVVPDLVVSVTFGSTRTFFTHWDSPRVDTRYFTPSTSTPGTAGSPSAAHHRRPNVAIQHLMLIAIWHMGTNGCLYDDPGADYFNRLNINLIVVSSRCHR